MSTFKNGSPDPVDADAAPRSIPWFVVLLAGGAALACALIVGTQAIGVLYAMLFPPPPPLPPDVTLIEHIPRDHGVDQWLYRSAADACSVAVFYRDEGGICSLWSLDCAGIEDSAAVPFDEDTPNLMGRCIGDESFSIFVLRWDVKITADAASDVRTQFWISREVSWGGEVPPLAPQP